MPSTSTPSPPGRWPDSRQGDDGSTSVPPPCKVLTLAPGRPQQGGEPPHQVPLQARYPTSESHRLGVPGGDRRLRSKGVGAARLQAGSTLHRHQARAQPMELMEVGSLTDAGHHRCRRFNRCAAPQAHVTPEGHFAKLHARPNQRHFAPWGTQGQHTLRPPVDSRHPGAHDQVRSRQNLNCPLGWAFARQRLQFEHGNARRQRAQGCGETEPANLRQPLATATAR